MYKYLAVISYCGTEYCGWQKQKNLAPNGKTSIQQTLEKTLNRITGEEVSVIGIGRTDSGVHAVGQVAHFVLKKKEFNPRILQRGMNGLLPRDIRILQIQEISPEFHAQKSAEKKQYSYYF